ncbi:MAG: hypothetical protein ACI8S6_002182 [Myxococcota bacterium]|jgi:hypothetical protein
MCLTDATIDRPSLRMARHIPGEMLMPFAFRENCFVPPIARPALQLRSTSSTGEGVDEPVNAELKKLSEDTLASLKYSFAASAALPDREARRASVEADFQKFLGAISPERRERFTGRARAIVEASPEARTAHFGRYGWLGADDILGAGFGGVQDLVGAPRIDPAGLGLMVPTISIRPEVLRIVEGGFFLPMAALSARMDIGSASDLEAALEEQARQTEANGIVNVDRLSERYGGEVSEEQAGEGDLEGLAVLDKLRLEVKQVRCLGETNPEFWGSDEIAIGGTSIDEDGDVKQIGESYVGGDFEDGDARNYAPYLNLHWFNLTEGKSWPKKYIITMLLAEKDNGGFQPILNNLYAKVHDKVMSFIKNIVGTTLEAYLGSFLSEGSSLSSVIGYAVAWVVDQLFGWIINAFADDVFPPATLTLNHAALGGRFSINGHWGYSHSPWYNAYFSGHGGKYRVTYRWHLYS